MLVALIGVSILYFARFHYGITNDINNWGNVGSFFGGVITPIMSAINIIVFIEISLQISKWDDKRAEENAKSQKTLLLMQFRKKEIENFENVMNEAFVPRVEMSFNAQVKAIPIVYASLYVQSFLTTKLNLFELKEDDEIVKKIINLSNIIVQYNQEFVKAEGNVENNLIKKVLVLRSEIVDELQKIALNADQRIKSR